MDRPVLGFETKLVGFAGEKDWREALVDEDEAEQQDDGDENTGQLFNVSVRMSTQPIDKSSSHVRILSSAIQSWTS